MKNSGWESWPEWLRWILFAPAQLLAVLLANLAMRLFLSDAAGWHWWKAYVFPAISTEVIALAWFPMLTFLVPRWKMGFAWVSYLFTMAWCVSAILLGAAQWLGALGLLGPIRPPVGWSWEERDTAEWIQSAVWIVQGSVGFFETRRALRTKTAIREMPLMVG